MSKIIRENILFRYYDMTLDSIPSNQSFSFLYFNLNLHSIMTWLDWFLRINRFHSYFKLKASVSDSAFVFVFLAYKEKRRVCYYKNRLFYLMWWWDYWNRTNLSRPLLKVQKTRRRSTKLLQMAFQKHKNPCMQVAAIIY